MNKTKRNALILIISLLMLAAIGVYIQSMTERVEFEEFSVEVPVSTEFITVTSEGDPTVKEMYRADGKDLTITSFDRKYIEDTYYEQTGEHINYAKGLVKNLTHTGKTTKISKHLTRVIRTTDMGGYEDTDVACIYVNRDHVIIVEGGDVDFITKVSKSIDII